MPLKLKQLIILIVVLSVFCAALSEAAHYGLARDATPVLNAPDFRDIFGGRDGKTLKTDRCGQIRELEFIALPGASFRVLGEIKSGTSTVYRVETDEYPTPAKGALYVDSRLIEARETAPPPRLRKLPTVTETITALKAAAGAPYVWGGNVQKGIPGLAGIFYNNAVPAKEMKQMTLAGLDCSGLLYYATNGWTPRNTSQLVAFGRGVSVAGRTSPELALLLQPLDLIVWNGHVIIVLDRETVIESRLECGKPGNGGVVMTPLAKRLKEIMATRRPVDEWPLGGKQGGVFVVRRWLEP